MFGCLSAKYPHIVDKEFLLHHHHNLYLKLHGPAAHIFIEGRMRPYVVHPCYIPSGSVIQIEKITWKRFRFNLCSMFGSEHHNYLTLQGSQY